MRARERNVGWRIDYFLVSDDAAGRITGASILDDVYGSELLFYKEEKEKLNE